MSAGSALIQRNSLLKIGELRAYSRTAMKEITHNPLVVLPQFRFMYFPNDIENGMSILAIMSIRLDYLICSCNESGGIDAEYGVRGYYKGSKGPPLSTKSL